MELLEQGMGMGRVTVLRTNLLGVQVWFGRAEFSWVGVCMSYLRAQA